MRRKWQRHRCRCGYLIRYEPKPTWTGKLRCPACGKWTEVTTLEKVAELMKKKKSDSSEVKPAKTVESTPTVEGVNVMDKIKAKSKEIHELLMSVKPGPIKLVPSGIWVSYHADIKPKPIRFAALEAKKKEVRVHSLALDGKKIAVEVIKIGPDDAVPADKIRSRAEGFITAKQKKNEKPVPESKKRVEEDKST